MKVFLFILISQVATACITVPAVVPAYPYDPCIVEDYRIISASKGFVGKRTGWEVGICDDEGHEWSIIWDSAPVIQTMLHPDDPNHLLVGFIPQSEGVKYFLFRLSDGIDESKFCMVMDVKDNTPPKVGWIKKLVGWLFD